MTSGYITCPCDCYEPGPDGICLDPECGHDAHQHNAGVGPHESCLAQEGDDPGCYLPGEVADVHPCAFDCCADPAAHAEGAHDL